MNQKVEHQQKYLSPLTLRLIQVLFGLFRSKPIISPNQTKENHPFFIIGSGRCGSTLLRSLLIQHPDLHIPPESAALPSIIKKYYRYNGSDWKDLVNIILGEFSSFGAYKYWQINVWDLKEKLHQLPKKEQSLYSIATEIYRLHMQTHAPQTKVWGDKTTFNTLRLQWIDKLFPNAKYINLIRDGRDVVSSYLKSGLITEINDIIWRWNTAIERAENFSKHKSPNSFINIKYEDLVSEPEKHQAQIFKFLSVNKNKSITNRNVNEMGDTVLSHHENVKNPVNTKSIGKWKEQLTPEQQEIINTKMGANLKKLGYS